MCIRDRGTETSLSGFLDEIALYTDLDSRVDGDNCVTMMTMHAAKGLEFPQVFVVGMEEGLFPGNRAMGDAEAVSYTHLDVYKRQVPVQPGDKDLHAGQQGAHHAPRCV